MSELTDFKLTDVSYNCLQILRSTSVCMSNMFKTMKESMAKAAPRIYSQAKLPSVSLSLTVVQNPNRPMSGCVDELLSLHAIGTWS